MEVNTKICTLKDLLRKINKRFDVDLRENLYCFKIHEDNDTKEDIENIMYNSAILDYKTVLKNIVSKELDLVPKVYGDSIVGAGDYSREEIMTCSMKMGALDEFRGMRCTFQPPPISVDSRGSESSESFNESFMKNRANTVDKERHTKDFLFNELTSKKLQEFYVVKINSKGKRQNRILGIDGYNIYNDKVSNRKKSKKYKLFK